MLYGAIDFERCAIDRSSMLSCYQRCAMKFNVRIKINMTGNVHTLRSFTESYKVISSIESSKHAMVCWSLHDHIIMTLPTEFLISHPTWQQVNFKGGVSQHVAIWEHKWLYYQLGSAYLWQEKASISIPSFSGAKTNSIMATSFAYTVKPLQTGP